MIHRDIQNNSIKQLRVAASDVNIMPEVVCWK